MSDETLVQRLQRREAQCRRLAYPDHPPIFVELADDFAEAVIALQTEHSRVAVVEYRSEMDDGAVATVLNPLNTAATTT